MLYKCLGDKFDRVQKYNNTYPIMHHAGKWPLSVDHKAVAASERVETGLVEGAHIGIVTPSAAEGEIR